MKYWLHRIGYLQNISYPFLEKGYISIGFSDFCTKTFFDNVVKNEDWDFMEKDFKRRWKHLPRNRYDLWRFLVEMKKGDIVLVPSWGTFSIYKISDDLPIMATNENVNLPNTDWNDTEIVRGKDGFLRLANEKEHIGLGFFRKVSPICLDLLRTDYADAALTSRMKIRGTNADISDLKGSIQKAILYFKKNKPINLKADILEKTVKSWNEAIHSVLNPNKYEKLVKWYFKKIGATESIIPAKNSRDKVGDVDVIATFEPLKTIINVQVKFHNDETSDMAIRQIKDFAKSKENMFDGYTRQYWVISSSEKFTKESYNMAMDNNILLIDGKQFVRMLFDVGLETLESFEL